eukprot:7384501-Prymnesium_polylepis.3
MAPTFGTLMGSGGTSCAGAPLYNTTRCQMWNLTDDQVPVWSSPEDPLPNSNSYGYTCRETCVIILVAMRAAVASVLAGSVLAASVLAASALPDPHNPTPTSYPTFSNFAGKPYNVSYDSRAITLNGEHALFISGAVHPPRGTQGDWDSWFDSAKANGLNMLQVYVFWNFHEEVEGEFNFAGRGDLSEFVGRAGKAGMFVNLRVGPYVCAEWTYGGLPTWLGLKPGVAFRQTNAVWQPAMA